VQDVPEAAAEYAHVPSVLHDEGVWHSNAAQPLKSVPVATQLGSPQVPLGLP